MAEAGALNETPDALMAQSSQDNEQQVITDDPERTEEAIGIETGPMDEGSSNEEEEKIADTNEDEKKDDTEEPEEAGSTSNHNSNDPSSVVVNPITDPSVRPSVADVAGKINSPDRHSTITIELPRDILTAFFLLRLPRDGSRNGIEKGVRKDPLWDDYTRWGRGCLWCSVLIPYIIQFYVLINLIGDIQDSYTDLADISLAESFFMNTCAFSVLFVYLWKDLALLYYSVWFYINWFEQKELQGEKAFDGVMRTGRDLLSAAADSFHAQDSSMKKEHQRKVSDAKMELQPAVEFLVFKVWLLAVFVLYVGITVYALITIPLSDKLIEKLEDTLGIFIVLEVDDWAYELFIAKNNILDDEDFDVNVVVQKSQEDLVKKREMLLTRTLVFVVISIFSAWAIAYGLQTWIGDD